MGSTADSVSLACDFIEEFLYWKEPSKTLALVKEVIKLPIVLAIGVYFMPIRYLIVLGIWAVAGMSSPFFKSLFLITLQKVRIEMTQICGD